jgi:hypothetical protein
MKFKIQWCEREKEKEKEGHREHTEPPFLTHLITLEKSQRDDYSHTLKDHQIRSFRLRILFRVNLELTITSFCGLSRCHYNHLVKVFLMALNVSKMDPWCVLDDPPFLFIFFFSHCYITLYSLSFSTIIS